MKTQSELLEIVKNTISEQIFKEEPKELFDPINYTISLGGKRIRPVLTLMCCELFNGNIYDALYPAIGLELFHNFTLIHDDILDNAPLRRGKETVFKKWDINTAILSGDTLFAISYKYVFKTKEERIIPALNVFNDSVVDVCRGQQYDMNFETMAEVSIKDYIEMIRLKTAVLLGACARIGAVIANTTNDNIQKITAFAENLGIAFQLQDDLLDLYGDEKIFGKKIGNDIESNKKTYLYLKALEDASGIDREVLINLFKNKDNNFKEKIERVKSIYDKLDIKNTTLKEIDLYYIKAIENFNQIDVAKENKHVLFNFAQNLMSREY